METGMKYWLGAVVAACALVTVWALPPSTGSGRTRAALPEEVRYQEVTTELQRAHGILVATRWSDSLSALVVGTAVDGLALALPPSTLVTSEGIEEWRTRMASHVDSLEPRDPRMTVGVVFQQDTHGALDGVILPRIGIRPQTYIGVRDGTPYCFVVFPRRYPSDNRDLRSVRTLESCGLYAKYGMPGAAVGTWLEAGGLAFAREGRTEQLDALLGPTAGESRPFGLTRPFPEQLVVAGCLAGRAEACAQALTDPAVLASRSRDALLVANSPMSHMAGGAFTPFARRSAFLLFELEAQYGPAAFARFWTSEASVPEAFEGSFGVELGAWVLGWAEEEIGLFRAGPTPTAATVGWSLVALMILSGLASATAMQRRVG